MVKKKTKAAAKRTPTPNSTGISKTEPEAEHPLVALRNEFENMFNRYFGGVPDIWPDIRWPDFEPFRAFEQPGRLTRWALTPRVDLAETDAGYEVSAEIPGLDENDVEVNVSGDTLTIRGEKQEQREETKRDYHVKERHYGSFRRSFRIPDDVDLAKIGATFTKGVLKVNMPKSKRAKGKRRTIKVQSD